MDDTDKAAVGYCESRPGRTAASFSLCTYATKAGAKKTTLGFCDKNTTNFKRNGFDFLLHFERCFDNISVTGVFIP